MSAKRTAHALWEHDLVSGHGSVRGESGAIPSLDVSWASRTEAPGGKTSPEELLAAAHAACFAMAFAATLARNQKPPERLSVSATCTFEKVAESWKVTTMDLDITGKVPGVDNLRFQDLARTAEKGCPISNAIRGNVEVRLSARLE